jgi:hypothetical protein
MSTKIKQLKSFGSNDPSYQMVHQIILDEASCNSNHATEKSKSIPGERDGPTLGARTGAGAGAGGGEQEGSPKDGSPHKSAFPKYLSHSNKSMNIQHVDT